MSVVQGDCGVVSMVQGVVQSGTVRGCRNVWCGECGVVSVMQPAWHSPAPHLADTQHTPSTTHSTTPSTTLALHHIRALLVHLILHPHAAASSTEPPNQHAAQPAGGYREARVNQDVTESRYKPGDQKTSGQRRGASTMLSTMLPATAKF